MFRVRPHPAGRGGIVDTVRVTWDGPTKTVKVRTKGVKKASTTGPACGARPNFVLVLDVAEPAEAASGDSDRETQ